MSKKVAASYLEEVAKVSATVTVYFTDESQLKRFMTAAKAEYGSTISYRRGFDYVLFMSTDTKAVQEIQKKAQDTGLDYSGF